MIKLLTHLKHRNFARLWFAQLTSQFGDRIHQLALVGLLAHRHPGSSMALAKVIAFTIIPVFFVQPFAGVVVDRLNKRTTLFLCDLIRGVLVLLIPLVFMNQESMIPIYIIVFLVFCFSRFYVPAKMSIIPEMIDEENLLKANSLFTTTGMIAVALGAALGGFFVEKFGARNGFLIDAATYFISALFLFSMSFAWRLKAHSKDIIVEGGRVIVEQEKTFWADFKEGFKYLIDHKEIRFVINITFILFASAGALYVTVIVFIQEVFQSVTKDLGILAVSLGLGLFAGAVLYGNLGKKFSWYKTIFAHLGLSGILCIVFAQGLDMTGSIWLAIVIAFLWGMAIGPIVIASNTIIHVVSDKNMQGKVFSALEMIIHFAFLVTMFLTSFLAESFSKVWILTVVGGIVAIVSLIGYLKPTPKGVLENT